MNKQNMRNRMMSPAERQKHKDIEDRFNQVRKLQRPGTPKKRYFIQKKPYQPVPADRSLTTIPYDQHQFVKNLIIRELEKGMNFEDACLLSGIDHSTGYRWKHKDANFAKDCHLAVLQYKKSLIDCVSNSALKNPKIALEVLRTHWKDEWNAPQKLEHEGTIETTVNKKQLADMIQEVLKDDDQSQDTQSHSASDPQPVQKQ